jgi:hypothetical protein
MRRERQVASLAFSAGAILVGYLVYLVLPTVPLWLIVVATIVVFVLGILLSRTDKTVKIPIEQDEILRADFHNQVFEEIVSVPDYLDNAIVIPSRINCPIWKSKLDGEKILLLGENDWRSLDRFYRTIDRANEIQTLKDASRMIQDAIDGESRRAIVLGAKGIFREIEWLKHREQEILGLLERLEQRYQVNSSNVALNMISGKSEA